MSRSRGYPPTSGEDSSPTSYEGDDSPVNAYEILKKGGLVEILVRLCFQELGAKLSFKAKVVVFICKTITNSILSALGLFFLYLIFFRPYAVRPSVNAAALAAFNLATAGPGPGPGNSTLQYDLALNVTFFNDHRIWAIRFNHFAARLYFDGTNVSPPDVTFPKFKVRTRRHRTVHLLLRGRAGNVSVAMADEFSRERAQGWFAIEIRLKSTLTYVIWPIWYVYYYEYDCWLHFPSNATTPVAIGAVKCSKGKRFGFS